MDLKGITKEIVLLILVCGSTGIAEDISSNEPDFEPYWKGIWSGDWKGNELIIVMNQNEKEVTGTYTYARADSSVQGIVNGTLSDDGMELSGTWTESGNMSLSLNGDMRSIAGTWGYSPASKIRYQGVYSDGWNGIWNSDQHSLSLLRNGSEVAGTFVSIEPQTADSGFIRGNLSEDEMTVTGTYTCYGNIVYTMSEGGTEFYAGYDYGHGSREEEDFWIGKPIQNQAT